MFVPALKDVPYSSKATKAGPSETDPSMITNSDPHPRLSAPMILDELTEIYWAWVDGSKGLPPERAV